MDHRVTSCALLNPIDLGCEKLFMIKYVIDIFFENFDCSGNMMCCYHGCVDSINEKETPQFTNNQLGTVINGRQGEKLCSSETKRVWM